MNIFICEDDPLLQKSLVLALEAKHQLILSCRLEEARERALIAGDSIDLYIIDLDLEYPLAGLDLLDSLKDLRGEKIILTGRDEDQVVDEAFARGAAAFLLKPFSKNQLENILRRYDPRFVEVADQFQRDYGLPENQVLELKGCLQSELPVLLLGESGTGKTRLAEELHHLSSKKDGPFISLNCSALTETLLESTLFGHKKGAFTGAISDQLGKLELADGGTLFLDEIGCMPLSTQTKLLKAVEEMRFYPVGSATPRRVQFRLMAATCDRLHEMVESGRFREDLYFRLKGHCLTLPPLRTNPTHLKKIIKRLLNQKGQRMSVSPEAWDKLLHYPWPGNYRELSREIEKLRESVSGILRPSDLEGLGEKKREVQNNSDLYSRAKERGLKNLLAEIEQELIERGLQENRGQVRQTLKQLKISTHAFYRARYPKA